MEGFCSLLAPDNAVAFGSILGRMAGLIDLKRKKKALKNLQLCFGDSLRPRERIKLLRGVYEHIGMCFVESLIIPRLIRDGTFRRRVRIEGMEKLKASTRFGKGIIFVTGHIGNWEITGLRLSSEAGGVVSVGQRLGNPFLDSRLDVVRTDQGQRVVPPKGALPELIKQLRRGGNIGLVVDQRPPRGSGVVAKFFGLDAKTYTTPAVLAQKYSVVALPVYSRREGKSFRHCVYVADPIPPPPSSDDDEILRLTQRINDIFEKAIRAAPEQWLWVYNRWKIR